MHSQRNIIHEVNTDELSDKLKKARTPSGNVISVNFGDIRNLFSPERYQVKEVKVSEKAAYLKINHPLRQRLRNSRSTKHISKQGESIKVERRPQKPVYLCVTPTRSRSVTDIEELQEADNYFTPPATPSREKINIKETMAQSQTSKTLHSYLKEPSASNQQSVTESEATATDHFDQPMEGSQETVTALNLTTVMGMFQKINERLGAIEKKDRQIPHQPHDGKEVSEMQKQIDLQKDEIKYLKRENFLLDRAAKITISHMNDLTERVAKLELNINKKMIIISGLFIYADNKQDNIKEVQAFFEYELDLPTVKVDDTFRIGDGHPPLCVVILSTLQDKIDIMSRKTMLKGVTNKANKSIYINDYWPADTNERRKTEREIYTMNQERPSEMQDELTFKQGNLLINSIPVKEVVPVSTPDPTEILDMEITRLNYILKLIVNRGKEVSMKGSRFIGYTAEVKDYQMIQEMYLKIKLIHPTANHVICAYRLPHSDNDMFRSFFCDDGEHGAGRVLLDHMKEHEYMDRVFFVVRYYGGTKLSADRFTCVIRAAENVMNEVPCQLVHGTPERSTAVKKVTQTPQEGQRTSQDTRGPTGDKKGTKPSSTYTQSKSAQRGAFRKNPWKISSRGGYNQNTRRNRGRGRGSGHMNNSYKRPATPPSSQPKRANQQHDRQYYQRRKYTDRDYQAQHQYHDSFSHDNRDSPNQQERDMDYEQNAATEDWSSQTSGAF